MEKRYNQWSKHLKDTFGTRVIKISLEGGFTCPNLDGSVGTGGCTYCSSKGSGEHAGKRHKPLAEQFQDVKAVMNRKWPEGKYLPYFQAYSNTYAPVAVLKEKYEEVLNFPDVCGLDIATRADCLPDDVIEYLGELATRTNLWVELGLQTSNDKTSDAINRGHNYETFVNSVNKLRAKNINVVVHIINGLPGETKEDMLQTIHDINKLDIQVLKIHSLLIIKNTLMAEQYLNGEFSLLSKEEYIDIVCEQLRHLRPDITIARLTGDANKDIRIAPDWSDSKRVILNEIDHKMKDLDARQGDKYE